jgi:hypothetical protein
VDRDQVQRFKEMPLDPREFGVTDEQAQELQRQAQETFDLYFRNSEPLSPDGNALCDL